MIVVSVSWNNMAWNPQLCTVEEEPSSARQIRGLS